MLKNSLLIGIFLWIIWLLNCAKISFNGLWSVWIIARFTRNPNFWASSVIETAALISIEKMKSEDNAAMRLMMPKFLNSWLCNIRSCPVQLNETPWYFQLIGALKIIWTEIHTNIIRGTTLLKKGLPEM